MSGWALRQLSRRHGYLLVPDSYYSPIPDTTAIQEAGWNVAPTLDVVDLDLDSSLLLLESRLAPYIAEFDPPMSDDGSGFHLDNGTYGSGDAETLYAMVRHARPARVVELGSGASTHVIAAALAANGGRSRHIVFDPFPFSASEMGSVESAEVRPVPAELLTPGDLDMLEPGDVLFVDTTHTVKTGGDCVNIYLRLLPSLPEGVLIHVHDIFLPFDYPKGWVFDERRAWAEQYLLAAFLLNNDRFRVLLPLHALTRLRREGVSRSIPSFGPGVEPGAFWMVGGMNEGPSGDGVDR